MPENENEILIPDHLQYNGGSNLQVGDTITLQIGKRKTKTGEELFQSNPYITKEDAQDSDVPYEEEYIEVETTKTYTIVGIIERPNFEIFSAPGYTLISTGTLDETKPMDISLLFSNPKDTYNIETDIIRNLQLEYTDIQENQELLRWQGVSKYSSDMNVVTYLAIIVILILMFTSIFVIRNSFRISVTERTKQLGMLASIGATSKQIKKSVLYEGFILGAIAIPLGIIVGIIAIAIVISVVSTMLATTSFLEEGVTLQFTVSIPAIIVTVIASIITIYLSCISPARKAAKIAPIDAIRESNDVKIKNKTVKTSKFTKKMMGIEGELAVKNLKRSRKKYRTTIFSIFLSIVLFLSMSAFIQYGFIVTSANYQEMNYNLLIRCPNVNDQEALQYYAQVRKIDGIERASIVKRLTAVLPEKFANSEIHTEHIFIYAVGDEEYSKYLQELGLNKDKVKDKAILCDDYIRYEYDETGINVKRTQMQSTNIEEGEMLTFQVYDEEQETYVSHQIEIAKRTSKLPTGIQNQFTPTLIVSDSTIGNLDYYVDSMYIQAKDVSALEEKIATLEGSNKSNIMNLQKEQEEQNTLVIIISIFLYGFIIVISLIGITNVFNTITTNMALREKEFAILKSIGMTTKEFKRMIRYESILYGLKALLLGIPVGIVLSYIIYSVIAQAFDTGYQIPWIQIGICIVFVFAIIFITMRYSMNKTKKQNIIETIRKENI